MKQKLITAAIIFCIAILIGVLFLLNYRSGQTIFNISYVNGSLPGNLYNTGLICESGDKIFFANPSDSYKLYSMNQDGSELKKLTDDTATYINADKNYIYYVCNNERNTGEAFSFLNFSSNVLLRVNRDGSKRSSVTLDDVPCMYAALVGDYVYYLHYDKSEATTLYRVKIDRNEKEQIDKTPYYTCGVSGQYIYYNGLSGDHNIWRLNTANNSRECVYQGNCWMPVPTENGNVIYFLDCDDNYKLASVNVATGEKKTLCDDRIDCFNVYGSYIYFQRNGDDAALCRMTTSGSDYIVVAEGNYKDINITGRYVYCREFHSNTMLRTSTAAPGPLETFSPGVIE